MKRFLRSEIAKYADITSSHRLIKHSPCGYEPRVLE